MLFILALKAFLIALVPATLVYLSRGKDKVKKLAWVTVFFTFDLIVFGAFTRLTDSGLGCPDWPGCYGQANPFLAHADVSAAQAAMPSGPVTVFKAWIEMIHRYLAMGVGVLIIGMVIVAWVKWRQQKLARYAPAIPLVLLAFVCVQGAFGAWTVTLKLQPVIVTTHLILGMGLLGLLVWHAMRQSQPVPLGRVAGGLRLSAALVLVILFMQIALGGWVSTNYATLACTTFPLCQGSVVPEMDFTHGFTLWRKLGMTAAGDYLPFPALVAIHWLHRSFAFVVIALVVWLGLRVRHLPGLGLLARSLWLVIGVQFLTGVGTVFFEWPLVLAVLHNAGSAAMVVLLVVLNYRLSLPGAGVAVETQSRLSSA